MMIQKFMTCLCLCTYFIYTCLHLTRLISWSLSATVTCRWCLNKRYSELAPNACRFQNNATGTSQFFNFVWPENKWFLNVKSFCGIFWARFLSSSRVPLMVYEKKNYISTLIIFSKGNINLSVHILCRNNLPGVVTHSSGKIIGSTVIRNIHRIGNKSYMGGPCDELKYVLATYYYQKY